MENKSKKCSETQKGRIVIHLENSEKRIYENQLAEYLEAGWEKGQSEAHKEKQTALKKGRSPWNKGTKGVMHASANNSPWKKGHTPWNKGIETNPLTDEQKEKIIEIYTSGKTLSATAAIVGVKKGKCYDFLTAQNLMRSKHDVLLGRPCSEDTKAKISAARIGHDVPEHVRQAVSKANKSRSKEFLDMIASKSWLTKKLNGTCSSSKPEEDLYQRLLKENVNKTIHRNYKDDRYPFHCDFYIEEDDLFIELNAHWTHGPKPFDPDDPECIELLDQWKEKAKKSKFYEHAIYVWTDLDVRKAQTAKEHNLNYEVIY